MNKKSILVLGGGIGGLVAANELRDRLKDYANVTLIERKRVFQFPPSYAWLMLGTRKPAQVQKSLDALRRKGIEVVNDEIISIDVDNRSVKTGGGEFSYDYLIISLGAEYSPNTIPGFSEFANHIYDLDSATRFGDAVEKFSGGTIAVGISRTPFKCPAAPYEVAMLLEDYYTNKGIRGKVRFEFFTPEPYPVPSVGAEIGNRVSELMKSRGITYHPKLRLKEIKKDELIFESGEVMNFNLLFTVPPHVAPAVVVKAGLTDGSGWIPVNSRTLETKHEGVFAIGDVTSVPTPSGYVPTLSKAGVFAHGEAKVVANNIAARIKGRGKAKEWDGIGSCFLEVGGGKSAFVDGNFLAEPKPEMKFHEPSRILHAQKVAFERYWLRHWF